MLLLSGSVRVASVAIAIATAAGATGHAVSQVASASPLLMRRRTVTTRIHHIRFARYGVCGGDEN